MALAILSAIGGLIQLSLIILQQIIAGRDEHKEEVKTVFKEGLNAVKNLDASGYTYAIQHLQRLRRS